MLAFLLIGLRPIQILSTNMFAFIPLIRHNLTDIFFSRSLKCNRLPNTGDPSDALYLQSVIAQHVHVYRLQQSNSKFTMSINTKTRGKKQSIH